MCSDHRGIDDGGFVIDLDVQFAEHVRPSILGGPVREAVVDGLPGTEALREIAPRNTSPRAKDHCVEKQAIAERRLSTLRPPRKKRLQAIPLLIGQGMPVHA